MTTTLTRGIVNPAHAPNRAARGAAWFDEHFLRWSRPIDLQKFNVANHGECPVAWICGDYSTGLDSIFRIMGHPRNEYTVLCDLGFDAPLGPDRDREAYYLALQVAWVKEICDRQAGGSK